VSEQPIGEYPQVTIATAARGVDRLKADVARLAADCADWQRKYDQLATARDVLQVRLNDCVAALRAARAEVDKLSSEARLVREAFTAAFGYYSCPCGSEFEFSKEIATLEDYAALNRWLGRHYGACADQLAADNARLENQLATARALRDADRMAP